MSQVFAIIFTAVRLAASNTSTPPDEWILSNHSVSFNNFVGSLGQLWIAVGLVLLVIPKTKKSGAAVLLSYALSFLIGNEWLKDLIARPRPCAVDDTVALIVKKPSSFSCPSVHTYLAFSSAAAIYHYHRKAGLGVFVFAALVGFSRMYFFVHYPTDVLFGAVLGILTAFVVCLLLDKICDFAKRKFAKNK